jgi:hypothetical protein
MFRSSVKKLILISTKINNFSFLSIYARGISNRIGELGKARS